LKTPKFIGVFKTGYKLLWRIVIAATTIIFWNFVNRFIYYLPKSIYNLPKSTYNLPTYNVKLPVTKFQAVILLPCHAGGHALDLGGRHQCKKAGKKMAPGVWSACVLS
jgi:hypothetical protein